MDKITDLKELLNNIGYIHLSDNGSFWRTNAVYRDGDNRTSLRINKNTGDFHDFVERKYGNINELIKLTLGIGDVELKTFYATNQINLEQIVERDSKPKLIMEKFWSESELANLLPHYKFYEDRGITKETLKFFKSGFAHSGAMNERFVFPIYSITGQIHGWSGRDMTNKKEAKWKHLGKKMAWIYPAYMFNKVKKANGSGYELLYPVLEAIKKTREIILVESIGDMLAHWERGQFNVIVTFGLELSSKLGSFIMSQDIDRVVIALNNDKESKKNNGKLAAISMFIELMHYIDFEKIIIALPSTKDFGEMTEEDFTKWNLRKNNYEKSRGVVYKEVLHELRERYVAQKITPSQIKFGKALKERYEETNPSQTQSVPN